ncbi:hypothetical protein OG736_23870 [Streptomyces sp. NBC_01334]|nr:hypothetical protein OG736_23870 [Streptomyces sp. NBC_01334]
MLAALVRAWGGDEAEWVKFRSRVEDERERARLELIEELGQLRPPRDDYPDYDDWPTSGENSGLGPLPSRNEMVRILVRRLADLDHPRYIKILDEGTLEEYVRSGHHGAPDLPHLRERDKADRRAQLARQAASEEAEDIANAATEWAALRYRAGNPTIRTISKDAQLPYSTVSKMLRGLVDPVAEPAATESVFNALRSLTVHDRASLDGTHTSHE